MPLSGRIVSQQKNVYLVDTDRGTVEAALRGTLKRKRSKPCVGDVVAVEIIEDEPLRGIINSVEPRRLLLRRPVIANVDHVLFLVSLLEPRVETETIDRFLVTAEDLELEATLVINKVDLLDDTGREELDVLTERYGRIGYRVLQVSAEEATGVDAVLDACRGKVSTMAGLSGVGKSTLLNLMLPDIDLRTAEVSARTSRGVHTTTSTILLCPEPGTYIADTPGFAVIDLPDIDPRDAMLCFPELRELVGACRFNNCLHRDEPGCAVKDAVEEGTIDEGRYRTYLRFYDELDRHDTARPTSRNQ